MSFSSVFLDWTPGSRRVGIRIGSRFGSGYPIVSGLDSDPDWVNHKHRVRVYEFKTKSLAGVALTAHVCLLQTLPTVSF
ncbi:hypothetical protein L596_026096 [Steinernema carpocapsae]|uniref:Uncharacterized protein n=1 Tax=Steinernema carpocapsae TaxID=34508 RepID=A0A4U5M0D7_STECR|nr:hypothetical protein L596_026096 [Steinernema carpocapsae]